MPKVVFRYFHGSCKILFRKEKEQQRDSFAFSTIVPKYIYISEVKEVADFSAEDHKAGRFLYFDRLTLAKGPSNKAPYIQFLKDQEFIYTKDIHKVLIKRFTNKDQSSYCTAVSDELYQIDGEVWFALPETVAVEKQPTEQISTEAVRNVKVNVLSRQINSGGGCFDRNSPSVRKSDAVSWGSRTATNEGCFGRIFNWIWRIFLLLLLLSITQFLWQVLPLLGIIAAISTLLWLISRFVPKLPLGNFFLWLVFGLYFGYLVFAKAWGHNALNTIKTSDGDVREEPPAEHEHKENGATIKDFRYDKHIEWYDFADRFFALDYFTLSSRYINSREVRESTKDMNLGSNINDYCANLYSILINNDKSKLDSIVNHFSLLAISRSLSDRDIAEMITTFVQEIDYVLIHDQSCTEAVSEAGKGSFVAQYHRSGKECLPGVLGGVQSPYEFVHNLKGDCDTRAVLAYTLLTELNISASVWVSEQYGHSILGVGLPVGMGSYKTINGIKHYGVELTAKGYRLGMVAPNQKNMNNWVIPLYKNF